MNGSRLFWIGLLIGLAAVCCLGVNNVQAQEPVVIDDALDQHDCMPYELTVYVDSASTASFQEISAAGFATNFKPNSDYQNKDFVKNASYWIEFPIRHNASSDKIWLLEFYDQTIDHLDVYIPQTDGTYKMMRMGDQQPFRQRTFMHKNFEIVLKMEKDTVMNYYFRVQSGEFADLRVTVRSVKPLCVLRPERIFSVWYVLRNDPHHHALQLYDVPGCARDQEYFLHHVHSQRCCIRDEL